MLHDKPLIFKLSPLPYYLSDDIILKFQEDAPLYPIIMTLFHDNHKHA